MAGRLRAAVAEANIRHIKNREGSGKVSVSIGVATALAQIGGTVTMPEALLLAADAALYRAKNEGRNRSEPALLLASERGGTAA